MVVGQLMGGRGQEGAQMFRPVDGFGSRLDHGQPFGIVGSVELVEEVAQ